MKERKIRNGNSRNSRRNGQESSGRMENGGRNERMIVRNTEKEMTIGTPRNFGAYKYRIKKLK